MKFKIKYADQIVGFFTIVALIVLIILIFSIGSQQKWFEKKYQFTTEFDSAANVSEGMSIQYKGFSIGKITNLTLNQKDTVDADFYILEEFYFRVKQGSVLELSVSPIGLGTQLLFHPGKSQLLTPETSFIPRSDSPEGLERIANGEVEIPKQNDTVTSLVASVGVLLTNLNKLIPDLDNILTGKSDAPLSITLHNLQSISTNLNLLSEELSDPTGLIPDLMQSEGTIGSLFNETTLYDNLNETMETLNIQIAAISTAAANTMGTVAQAVQTNVPQIMAQIQTTLINIQDVLQGLKNNPLIKNGIENKAEDKSPTPVFRDMDF